MSKKKKSFNIMGKLHDAVDSAVDTVKDIDLSDVKEKIQETADSAKDAVKDIDLSEAKEKIQDTADSAKDAVKKVKLPDVDVKNVFKKKEGKKEKEKKTDEVKGKKETPNQGGLNITALSTKSAIKIIYYLMAADGEIYHSEEEKFDSIGKELDPKFAEHKEQIVKECRAQLDKVIDKDDYYDTLQDGIEDALINSKPTEDSFVTPKLLVWDLLTIAYSDENYDETERKLLKYVVRKTDIDKAVFLEMENSILTLMDVEKELNWIKTTEKPYLTIEAMVNELMERRSVIFESVKDLIAL